MQTLSFLYEEDSSSFDQNLQPVSFLSKALNLDQSDISLELPYDTNKSSRLSSLQVSRSSIELENS